MSRIRNGLNISVKYEFSNIFFPNDTEFVAPIMLRISSVYKKSFANWKRRFTVSCSRIVGPHISLANAQFYLMHFLYPFSFSLENVRVDLGLGKRDSQEMM